MLFKNLQLFRLSQPFSFTPEALNEKLEQQAFRACGSLELSTYGWVPPLGRQGQALVHAANGYMMVCLRKEEKVLPAAVVREVVNDKVAEIEDEQMRPVRRKERNAIRDDVMQDLLPRAFTRSNLTYAYIAARDGWIVVDAGSPRKAEELTSLLRESLGSLPAAPPKVADAPAAVMTHWLGGKGVPGDFQIQDECELREPGDEGGHVRCKGLDLLGDEVQAHLNAGKRAVRIATAWNERLSCVLTEDLSVKRLRFEDVVQEELSDVAGDDAARFDAEFALMTLELSRFIPRLMDAFGGEVVDQ